MLLLRLSRIYAVALHGKFNYNSSIGISLSSFSTSSFDAPYLTQKRTANYANLSPLSPFKRAIKQVREYLEDKLSDDYNKFLFKLHAHLESTKNCLCSRQNSAQLE